MVKGITLHEIENLNKNSEDFRKYPKIPKGTLVDVEDRYIEDGYGKWYVIHYDNKIYYTHPFDIEIVTCDTPWFGSDASPICPHCGVDPFEEYLCVSEMCEFNTPFKFCPHCGKKLGEGILKIE